MITPAQPLSIYVGLRGKLDAAAPLVAKGSSLYKTADALTMDRGRAISRGQCRAWLGQVQYQHRVERCDGRHAATRDQHARHTQRHGFRRANRFQLAVGPVGLGVEVDAQQSQQRGRATTLDCAAATCNPATGASGLDAPVITSMVQRLEWFGTLVRVLAQLPRRTLSSMPRGVLPSAGSDFRHHQRFGWPSRRRHANRHSGRDARRHPRRR